MAVVLRSSTSTLLARSLPRIHKLVIALALHCIVDELLHSQYARDVSIVVDRGFKLRSKEGNPSVSLNPLNCS